MLPPSQRSNSLVKLPNGRNPIPLLRQYWTHLIQLNNGPRLVYWSLDVSCVVHTNSQVPPSFESTSPSSVGQFSSNYRTTLKILLVVSREVGALAGVDSKSWSNSLRKDSCSSVAASLVADSWLQLITSEFLVGANCRCCCRCCWGRNAELDRSKTNKTRMQFLFTIVLE